MVQCTKIFFSLILKRFVACFEVFLEGAARRFLRRMISVAHRAIAFGFKTYRRGAEGAEETQRKQKCGQEFDFLCVISVSSAPLR
jgi:hypothetical protein